MNNKISFHLKYIISLLAIVILFFFFYGYFKIDYMPPVGNDMNDNHMAGYNVMKESLLEYGSIFPFWNPYILGGTTYLAKAYAPDYFYPLMWLLIIINPIWFAAKMIIVLSFIIAALGMYIFAYTLIKNKNAALISALLYIFNGFSITLLIKGWSGYMRAFALIPFILLSIFYAFKSKNWILFTIIAAVLLSMQVFAGGANTFLWTWILIGLLLLFKLIEYLLMKKKISKVIVIGILLLLLVLGLSGIRIFIELENISISERANGVPYEEALWQKIVLSCEEDPNYCIWGIIEPSKFPKLGIQDGFGFKIGIIGLILVLLGMYYKYNNKYVLVFGIIAIIALLFSLGTPIYYLLWKYVPGFAAHRYPHRALILFAFAASVISGYGYVFLEDKLKGKKFFGKYINLVFVAIILLLLFDLVFMGYKLPNLVNIKEEIANNEIYNYISQQKGTFRINVQDIYSTTRGLNHLLVPLGIQNTYGYEQTFNTEYLPIFLSAANMRPAEFFGINNVKYITSSKELNISNYEFVKKFNYSNYTQSEELNQTYLYENKKFLPRYYRLEKSVLLIGEDNSVKQTMYGLMLDNNFDPSKMMVVKGKDKVSKSSSEELKKFSAIILLKDSLDSGSQWILEQYVKDGGISLPDITKGEQSISNEDIKELFGLLSDKQYDEIRPEYVSPDKITIKADKKGFFVISEQYSIYPDWKAYVNGKETELFRVNGVISAVYANEGDMITIKYDSSKFILSAWISAITILIILAYLSYFIYKKRITDG